MKTLRVLPAVTTFSDSSFNVTPIGHSKTDLIRLRASQRKIFQWLVVVTCMFLKIFFLWPPDCQQPTHGADHLAIPLRIDIVEIFMRFVLIPIAYSIKNDFDIPQNVSEIRINRMVPFISIP